MSEWQPIETAPRDGTRILVHYRSGPYTKQCWSANEASRFIRVARWKDGKWILDMPGHYRTDATHWMPLPPAPETAP